MVLSSSFFNSLSVVFYFPSSSFSTAPQVPPPPKEKSRFELLKANLTPDKIKSCTASMQIPGAVCFSSLFCLFCSDAILASMGGGVYMVVKSGMKIVEFMGHINIYGCCLLHFARSLFFPAFSFFATHIICIHFPI